MFKKIFCVQMLLLMLCFTSEAQNVERYELKKSKKAFRCDMRSSITSKIDIGADEHWTGYWNGLIDDNLSSIGDEYIPAAYDAAICYPAGTAKMEGMTIEGIRFSFPSSDNISDVKAWMSTTLPQTAEDADIAVMDVSELTDLRNTDDPFIEMRFDKPYVYDSNKNIYIGYSFKVNEGDSDDELFPLLVYYSEDVPNATLVKIRTDDDEWMDYYGADMGVLAIQILTSGELPKNSISMKSDLGLSGGVKGGDIVIKGKARNLGTEGVRNIGLTVTVNDEDIHVDAVPTTDVTAIDTEFEFDIKFKAPEESGVYDIKIKADEINGLPNEYDTESSCKCFVVTKAVMKRPFIEEFTAMWFGYCPRGIIGMQKLREIYGNDIVIASAHIWDALDCHKDYEEVLNTVSVYSSANVDRWFMGVDPYLGLLKEFGIDDLVEECKAIIPTAEVNIDAAIEGDILSATSEVEFLFNDDAIGYTLAYIVTEDGMHDESWEQDNFFTPGQGTEEQEPLFEPWVNAGSKVKNVIYDNVIIAAKGCGSGIEGSVKDKAAEGDINIHSVEFDLNDYPLIQDRERLNVIAVLFDTVNDRVVNANCVNLSTATNIKGIEEQSDIYAIGRYQIDGTAIDNPVKGINIIKYSDGSFRKEIVR